MSTDTMDPAEALAIHKALHSVCSEVYFRGSGYDIKEHSNCRSCEVLGVKFITQNTQKQTEYSQRARNGEKLTWITGKDPWGLIANDKIEIYSPILNQSPNTRNPQTTNKNTKKKEKQSGSSFLTSWWMTCILVAIIAIGAVFFGVEHFSKSSYIESRLIDKQTLEIGSGALKLMWATPIFTINLYNNSRIVGTDFNTTSFNEALHAAVVKEFAKFLKTVEEREGTDGHSKSGSSSRANNELFFAWQRDAWEQKGYTTMDKYPEFKHLKAIMGSAGATFLDMIGQAMPEDTVMFCWATIHRECMFHLAHTHPLNLVSGVYYARIPNGAGDIIFDDPRGPLPPFENRIIYSPKEGDLIVFPSWLLHQVSPTLGNEERISFSFNIPGDWTQTADVSLTIPFT